MDAAEQHFRRCYATVYDDLLRFVQRRVDPSHAEDVVADAFAVAWRRVRELPRTTSEQRAWIFTIARNLVLNAERGDRRRRALSVRVAAHGASRQPAHDDGVVAFVDLARSFRALRPQDQEVLALALWDGLSSKEGGQVLGISATAFRLRLSRARRALRTAHRGAGDAGDTVVLTEDEEGAVR